jgi:hypothetical protein
MVNRYPYLSHIFLMNINTLFYFLFPDFDAIERKIFIKWRKNRVLFMLFVNSPVTRHLRLLLTSPNRGNVLRGCTRNLKNPVVVHGQNHKKISWLTFHRDCDPLEMRRVIEIPILTKRI